MYDSVLRVPLLFRTKDRVRPGTVIDDLVQLIDTAPTILEAAGVEVPADFEARSLWGALEGREDYKPRDTVYVEAGRDHIQTGSEFIIMRRCKDWKAVVYLDDDDGELYDLRRDAPENVNLWRSAPPHRDKLANDCVRWALNGALKADRRPTRAPQRPMNI